MPIPDADAPAAATATSFPSAPPSSVVLAKLPEGLLDGTPYRAQAALGAGSMGLVVAAEHPQLGRVALKILLPEYAGRADLEDRMRLEFEMLARLTHPNVVRLLDHGQTAAGLPFLVLEYLEGITLHAALKARGRLTPAEALAIAREALHGLAAIHAAGVIHRDLKPANLFLAGPESTVKILDFGVAKPVGSARGSAPLLAPTAPGLAVGTPRYLSPEQIRGRLVDGRADLYAMGLCLYAMLTGRGPFDHFESLDEVMRAHLDLIPPLPSREAPEVPRWLDRVVRKALAKRPDDRFASAAEFAAALDVPIPVRAAPPSPAQVTPLARPDVATVRLPGTPAAPHADVPTAPLGEIPTSPLPAAWKRPVEIATVPLPPLPPREAPPRALPFAPAPSPRSASKPALAAPTAALATPTAARATPRPALPVFLAPRAAESPPPVARLATRSRVALVLAALFGILLLSFGIYRGLGVWAHR
jgi:eukaryotic-like serine/threonine-protein kinase